MLTSLTFIHRKGAVGVPLLLSAIFLITATWAGLSHAQKDKSQNSDQKGITQQKNQVDREKEKFEDMLLELILKERLKRSDQFESQKDVAEGKEGRIPGKDPEQREKLKLKKEAEEPEKLEPFGYAMFDRSPSSFIPQMGVPVGPDYVLGPGDDIIIYLWGNKLLMSLWEQAEGRSANDRVSREVEIGPEGTIFLPQVGAITVVGMTIDQLEKNLENRLQNIYAGIQVEVTLAKIRMIEIYVVGDAARLGSYLVNSMSTVFNGLYVAGGPSVRGSMRKIRLLRRDKSSKTIDLYTYILSGDKSHDYRLEAGDSIFVPPIGETASVSGSVVRPAIYELSGDESLKGLIKMAGGILPSAYLPRIQIDRIQDHQIRTVMDIGFDEIFKGEKGDIKIQNGDAVSILPVLETYKNRVSIEGNVRRPGRYELYDGMKISGLIQLAEGLLPDTYLEGAEIFRIQPDSTTQLIPLNLRSLLDGDKSYDLDLQNRDRVVIYSLQESKLFPKAGIRGEVNVPDRYDLTVGMRVSDLVFKAGGVKAQSAYFDQADLFRVADAGSIVALSFNLSAALKGDPQENLTLKNYDEVVIYSRVDLNKIPFAQVEGEIANPGRYQLASNMKLKDLIFRAGGPTGDAHRERGELIRVLEDGSIKLIPFNLSSVINGDANSGEIAVQHYDRVIVYHKSEIKQEAQATVKGEVGTPGTYIISTNSRISDLLFRSGGLTKDAYPNRIEVMRTDPNGTVKVIPVNATAVLNGDASLNQEDNILLKNNDQVIVYSNEQAKPQPIVKIYGEVQREGKYLLRENMHLSDLIFRSGNLKNKAYMDSAEIVRVSPDGDISKINVNLRSALEGDSNHDMLLKENDSVFIRRTPDSEERTVSIEGEVKFPGSYLIDKDETFSQILARAGGLTEKAFPEGMLFFRRKEKIEQFQILGTRPEVEAEVKKLKELEERGIKTETERQSGVGTQIESPSPTKMEGSQPSQPKASEKTPEKPQLLPEKPKPKEKEPPLGKIIIEQKDLRDQPSEPVRSDEIGTTRPLSQIDESKTIDQKIEKRLDEKLEEKVDQLIAEKLRETGQGQKGLDGVKAEDDLKIKNLGEKVSDIEDSEPELIRVTVDFKTLTNQKDISKFPLKNGDHFFIPERPIMVLVQGEVASAGGVMYKPNEGIKHYIEVSGGYTPDADKGRVYILRSNGRAVTSWLRYRKLGPGDMIIVPKKREEKGFDWAGTIRDTTSILSSALTVALIAQQLRR